MIKKIVRVGIAPYSEQKKRIMAIARGEYKPSRNEPKIWFSSIESLAQVLSTQNQRLLEIIAQAEPESVSELAEISGRKPSNLSRTLRNMERYGLVDLPKEGRKIAPKARYSHVKVDFPLMAEEPESQVA